MQGTCNATFTSLATGTGAEWQPCGFAIVDGRNYIADLTKADECLMWPSHIVCCLYSSIYKQMAYLQYDNKMVSFFVPPGRSMTMWVKSKLRDVTQQVNGFSSLIHRGCITNIVSIQTLALVLRYWCADKRRSFVARLFASPGGIYSILVSLVVFGQPGPVAGTRLQIRHRRNRKTFLVQIGLHDTVVRIDTSEIYL